MAIETRRTSTWWKSWSRRKAWWSRPRTWSRGWTKAERHINVNMNLISEFSRADFEKYRNQIFKYIFLEWLIKERERPRRQCHIRLNVIISIIQMLIYGREMPHNRQRFLLELSQSLVNLR